MRDRHCAHLAPFVTPLEPRASCVAVATRTSRGAACSTALEVPPPRGLGDAAACPHKGTVTPRILQLNFFFSFLAKIRALPFLFLFALAKP
jgi:hypothetical protein